MRSPWRTRRWIALLAVCPRHHGGPAWRVLRAARARLCARGGGVHAGRADAQPGAEPDALLAGIARRPRVSAAAAAGCALSGRAVTSRPQAEGGAHRRGRGRGRRSRVAAAAGNVADSIVQGQGPAGPSRRRTRDVQPEDDPDRHRPEPRAASDPGRGQRRGPRWTADGRPGGRRQLGRALGRHRLERRLRRDGGIDRRCGRPHARRRSRSRQLFGAEDQGRRCAGPGGQGGLGKRPQRAHRLRRPARRSRLRPGPGHPQARGTQAAQDVPGRRCRKPAPRAAGDSADHRDRDRPRQSTALRRQAGRRAPRRGNPGAGDPGRKCSSSRRSSRWS